MNFVMSPAIWVICIVLAVFLEWVVGDPMIFLHPVFLMRPWIKELTHFLNEGKYRKAKGGLMCLILVSSTTLIVMALQFISMKIHPLLFCVLNIWLISTAFTVRSIKQSGDAIEAAMITHDVKKASAELSLFIGKDTSGLSEEEMTQLTIKAMAKNTITGIAGPLFYLALGVVTSVFVPMINPLVLAMIYKAVVTMDSILGFSQKPHEKFNDFPRQLNNIFNFFATRVGAYLMILATQIVGFNMKETFRIYERDCNHYSSPNAGHPEAVVAGALGIQLGGKSSFSGRKEEDPLIGDATRPIFHTDIYESKVIMYVTEGIMTSLIVLLTVMLYIILT